ncbi:MAG: hypothetical protein FJ272_11735, partial [Planctomycetes bacterium]|nr:hypothetical protein [Planctomycetota bacterium]
MSMARLWAAGLVLFLAVSALGFAQQTQSTDEVICPRAEPPKLDGALDDACWQRAAEVSGFTKPLSDQLPRKATTARVCFDDRALYLAFECAEPQPERLRAKAQDGAPDVWKDDCVEIWIGSGESSLEYDQFICNAAGARQAVRQRTGSRERSWTADWQAKTQRGKDRWTAELAIPFATLGLGKPASGTLLQVKLGREDYAGGGHELATWPPKSRYGGTESCGRLYLETANLLPNADMAQQKDGQIAIWGFGKEDSGLFSSVKDGPRQVIRFNAPGRYSVAQQTLALKPNRVYRLDAEARGAASVYLRARTSAKKGDPSTPHTVNSKPSADYQKLELRFPSGET